MDDVEKISSEDSIEISSPEIVRQTSENALNNLKKSIFEKFALKDTVQLDKSEIDIDKLYQEKLLDYNSEEAKRKLLASLEAKIPEEELRKIRERLAGPSRFIEESIPKSYLKNSSDEEKLLELATTFQDEYYFAYPDKSLDFLFYPNEHGIQKIVCMTLCPYFCTHFALRSWEKCAAFVADYLQYKVLLNPVITPLKLVSPGLILKQCEGNSLDYSILLCSLLISAQYDAYVVQGFAERHICYMDLTMKKSPDLLWCTTDEELKKMLLDKKVFEVNKYNEYILTHDKKSKISIYDQLVKDTYQKKNKITQTNKEGSYRQALNLDESCNDPRFSKRLHFWVLVKSGVNDVTDLFFIEPTTGEMFDTSNLDYLEIEFVWNQFNFWINKQSLNKNGIKYDFNFDDRNNWTPFLSTNSRGENIESNGNNGPSVVVMPPSWVKHYDISTEILSKPFTSGSKVIEYHKATLEKFNKFLMKNGCTTRKITYKNENYEVMEKVEESYKHRNDFMIFHEANMITGQRIDIYDEGRDDFLKRHEYNIHNLELKREMTFYRGLRSDGLIRKVSTEEYIEDEYVGRKDYLLYRKETYLIPNYDNEFVLDKENEENKKMKTVVENQQDQFLTEGEFEELLTPYSFDTLTPMFKDLNLDDFIFYDFLDLVDPYYQYFSDSEEDEEMEFEIEKEEEEEEDSHQDIEKLISERDLLLKNELENNYNIWLYSLHSELKDDKQYEPIYSNLKESLNDLVKNKKRLKTNIKEKETYIALTEERTGAKTFLKKLYGSLQLITSDKLKANEAYYADDVKNRSFSAEQDFSDPGMWEKQRNMLAIIHKRKLIYRAQEIEEDKKILLEIFEIYGRDLSLPAEKNIHRIRFIADEGRYSIEFHPPENCLSARGIIFNKPEIKFDHYASRFKFFDELYKEINPGYAVKPFKKLYVYKELLNFVKSEQKLLLDCKNTHTELTEHLVKILKEDDIIETIPDMTNAAERAEVQEMNKAEYMEAVLEYYKNQEAGDYLTPAFPEIGSQMPLNEERATKAVYCLMENNISILERKIDKMRKKLKSAIGTHQKMIKSYDDTDAEEVTIERLESMEEDCKSANKSLHLTLMQCESLKDYSVDKYNTLKEQILNDTRLKAFTDSVIPRTEDDKLLSG